MNKSEHLYQIGQALWLDNLDRNLLLDGWLGSQICNKQIWGLTSNPSIFQKAISHSQVYQNAIQSMSWLGYDSTRIYEEIAIRDVQDAADLLYDIFLETGGQDGYVSLEINPDLAHRTEETISEAERLWKRVNRANIFLKIPATTAGISAIREAIAKGINVNVTLIFSLDRYQQVVDAYFEGLEQRVAQGEKISNIRSVASFFISRIDKKMDQKLMDMASKSERSDRSPSTLMGKIGIANALAAYQYFLDSIGSERFKRLSLAGGNVQRPLWASTSTKNPKYSDLLYVESLMLADTVNTVPNHTLSAFLDHGNVAGIDFAQEVQNAKFYLNQLDALGIDLQTITDELEREGVQAFSSAQEELLEEIGDLREKYQREIFPMSASVANELDELKAQDYFSRFCALDATLWSQKEDKKEEISHRLAWLSAPSTSQKIVHRAKEIRKQLAEAGFTHAVVLGMGGSSLAPEVYGHMVAQLKNGQEPGLSLSILDSSDPSQILETQRHIPLEKTVFIVSSKSGSTLETLSLFSYFWKVLASEQINDPGGHFIAITDPGSQLEALAKEKAFREIIQANPNVGGRYSALIEFGLIPAVFAGIDGTKLLEKAREAELDCTDLNQVEWNQGVALGIVLGAAYKKGRDKLTILSDPPLQQIGAWVEQLVAESSGKDGKGILPVQDEPFATPDAYGKDRIFVYLSQTKEWEEKVHSLLHSGQPVLTLSLRDGNDIARIFMIWEIAIATACAVIAVNAFDQPDVQLSKNIAAQMVQDYKAQKHLNFGISIYEGQGVRIYSKNKDLAKKNDFKDIFKTFLDPVNAGDYIAINAFITRNELNEKKLQQLRASLLREYKVATTLGFGPRFLHSTGQYHKGGKNNGFFIILTDDHPKDLNIPGEEMSFGALINAQALGDRNALEKQGRRVLHIHFTSNTLDEFESGQIVA